MRRIVAATVTSAVSVAVLAGCGSSGGQPGRSGASATPAAAGAVTEAVARQVLSQFVTVNNRADKLRQDSLLASYESGSSYRIDAGDYRWTLTSDPSNKNYSAPGPGR